MWRTAVITFVGVALLACSGGQGGVPTAEPRATPTIVSKADLSGRCGEDAPEATLSFEGQRQTDARREIHWIGNACAFDAHPIDTLLLPAEALIVPSGRVVTLSFSTAPGEATGSLWQPVLDNAVAVDGLSKIEVPRVDQHEETKSPLNVEAVRQQEIALDNIPPGEYVIEIYGSWPPNSSSTSQGTSTWNFRVKIVEAGGE